MFHLTNKYKTSTVLCYCAVLMLKYSTCKFSMADNYLTDFWFPILYILFTNILTNK